MWKNQPEPLRHFRFRAGGYFARSDLVFPSRTRFGSSRVAVHGLQSRATGSLRVAVHGLQSRATKPFQVLEIIRVSFVHTLGVLDHDARLARGGQGEAHGHAVIVVSV